MKTSIGFIVLASIMVPAVGVSQTSPKQGDRVRISQVDGSVAIGTVETWGADLVRLVEDDESQMVIPHGSVEAFQVATKERRFMRTFGITLAASSLGLGAISAVAWSPCTDTGFMACFLHPESRGQAFQWGLVGGAVIGVPVGLIAGLVSKKERWSHVQRVDRLPSGLSVRPVVGRRVGFTASLPVGGR